MNRLCSMVLVVLLMGVTQFSYARSGSYGARSCDSNPNVHCMVVQRGQSWVSLWPDPSDRDKVQRLNRMNTSLSPGMRIAVPNDLNMDVMQLSPFSRTM